MKHRGAGAPIVRWVSTPRSQREDLGESPICDGGYELGFGAAARVSRSLIASPRPCCGIGIDGDGGGAAGVELGEMGEEVRRRLDEVAGRAEIAERHRPVGAGNGGVAEGEQRLAGFDGASRRAAAAGAARSGSRACPAR